MKVVVLGAVAAGTKTAAKLKRACPGAEVEIYTMDREISRAACGLPYYVGGIIEDEAELSVMTPERFSSLTGASVHTGFEAVGLDGEKKTVFVKDLSTGDVSPVAYDRLVIATGASAFVPDIPGRVLPGVFTLRTPSDAVEIRKHISQKNVKCAVVVGGSFIGLEMADNLHSAGISVTVAEGAGELLPGVFDPEMAAYIRRHLKKQDIRTLTGAKVNAICAEGEMLSVETETKSLPAGAVIIAAGIRPNTAFLRDSGVELISGRIAVNEFMETSLPDVYAAGDCAMVKNRITGEKQWSPMGSSANLEGRVLGRVLSGEKAAFPGVLGTGILRLPELNCARTGLGEENARLSGFDPVTALVVSDDKPGYWPDASVFFTKLIADRATHRILGAQILGSGAVDKMADIAVAAICCGGTLEDIENGDFAYAPPFSTAIHPFALTVQVLQNKLRGDTVTLTPAEYAAGAAEGYTLIDAGTASGLKGVRRLTASEVRELPEGLSQKDRLLLVCNRGKGAYLLQNRLMALGFINTAVLEGGVMFNEVSLPVSAEEVARIKGLGFLSDKTTRDCFNVRVITRNGKITAEESIAIASGAKQFGSGEVAMTSRMTVEIQRVPYANVDALIDYLAAHGLETGGTGPKVRPVVSCKGTTCRFGLIDTFGLSEEIHRRFYKGYHGVKLPHKLKIAVGGCPNNCVKPDINDIGIIGQRVPSVEDSCRGCKVCQAEKNCPMKALSMENGKAVINRELCNNCGRCAPKCPFKAIRADKEGYRVFVGERWGKKAARGIALDRVFESKQDVLDTVESCILFFRDKGEAGERFGDTIARVGFETAQKLILSGELLERKNEIIGK